MVWFNKRRPRWPFSGIVSLAATLTLVCWSAQVLARPGKSLPGEEGVAGEISKPDGENNPEGPQEPKDGEDTQTSEEAKHDELGDELEDEQEPPQTPSTATEDEAEADTQAQTSDEDKEDSESTEVVQRQPPVRAEAPPSPRPKLVPTKKIKELDIRISGSLSMSSSVKTWPDDDGSGIEGFGFAFERVSLGLDGTYKGFIVSTDYRFYNKYGTLHHGYIGYRHGDIFEFDVGVHRVPFGILPYASHNWFETIPYYIGLADDYDLGLKWIVEKSGVDFQFAYYVQAEPSQFGSTRDSARYSYDIVQTDMTELGSSGVDSAQTNEEKHTGVVRLAYRWDHRGDNNFSEIGASGLGGGIYNREAQRFGYRWATAAHFTGTYRGLNLQLEGVYYDNRPRNPAGQSRMWLTLGAWDAPYRVARRGLAAVGNIAYRFPLKGKAFEWLMIYNDYSFLWKPDGFANTHMNVTGMLLANRYIYIYLDTATGRNHPWFSPEYGNALAEGETDPSFWVWVNLNLGFYM